MHLFKSKVKLTHNVTVVKVLNVKLIMCWNLPHQTAPHVSRPLITYVLKALTKELAAPIGPCSVLGYVNDMAAQRNCLL